MIFKNIIVFILLIITCFVLAAGAIALIKRALVFIFLIILSPAVFFLMVLPKTKQYFDKWLARLFNEAVFAPVFFFFIGTSVLLVEGSQGGADSLFNVLKGADSLITIVIYGIVVNGMMIGSLLVAKSLGAAGASGAMGGLKKLGAFAGGAVVGGGAAILGRNTIGRLAHAVAGSEGVAKWAAAPGAKGWMGRLAMRGSERVAGTSFDIRASKAAKAAGITGVLGGKPAKGGFAAGEAAKAKQEKETYENIKAKLGPEAAEKYASQLRGRSGAGQEAKTGAGVGAGAAAIGAMFGAPLGPVGIAAGAGIGAGLGAIYGFMRGRKTRLEQKASRYEAAAQEAEKAGGAEGAKKAATYRQRAERTKKKAEKRSPSKWLSAPAVNRETAEDLGGFEERALNKEISELQEQIKTTEGQINQLSPDDVSPQAETLFRQLKTQKQAGEEKIKTLQQRLETLRNQKAARREAKKKKAEEGKEGKEKTVAERLEELEEKEKQRAKEK